MNRNTIYLFENLQDIIKMFSLILTHKLSCIHSGARTHIRTRSNSNEAYRKYILHNANIDQYRNQYAGQSDQIHAYYMKIYQSSLSTLRFTLKWTVYSQVHAVMNSSVKSEALSRLPTFSLSFITVRQYLQFAM